MSKKIEMTPEQASLFSEMKKLSKRANQRIVRLERLTGETEVFAVKELADYLSSETLDAWTEKGRVAAKKSFTTMQMKVIIKETKKFLEAETSRVSGVKKFTKEESEKAGIPLFYGEASAIFQSRKDYQWIFDYFPGSSYWDFARVAVARNWNYDTFEIEISRYITDKRIDESMRKRLQRLFEYSQGVK